MSDKLSGAWDLSLDAAKHVLRVHYTVSNSSKERIYVSDELLKSEGKGLVKGGSAIVVVNGASPGEVRFVRAAIGTDRPLAVLYPTTYVALEPGASLERTATAAWPLAAWHNLGWVRPLEGSPRQAFLELHYFSGEPPKWRELPAANGPPIRVPEDADPEPLRLGPLELPKA